MANWSKTFTNISGINSGQEFTINDYLSTQAINGALNNTQYLYENCVGTYYQTFNDTQKAQARANIGAGTSNFSGDFNDLTNKPDLKLVATTGKYSDLNELATIYNNFLYIVGTTTNGATVYFTLNISSATDTIKKDDNLTYFVAKGKICVCGYVSDNGSYYPIMECEFNVINGNEQFSFFTTNGFYTTVNNFPNENWVIQNQTHCEWRPGDFY